jgi:adenosylmethionine-8-amino-7-oxononanoate aminotransferase
VQRSAVTSRQTPPEQRPDREPTRLPERDKRFILHPHQVVGEPDEPLIIARGRGARIWGVDGREYVDTRSEGWTGQ